MSDDLADPWVDVAADAEITPSTPVVVRHGSLRVAVLRNDEGTLLAVDDRCPHEGYPLAQGQLRGCVLTCAWHNFKFDLRTGACIKGDEAVAVFPVRVADGRVQVDPRLPVDENAVDRGFERLRDAVWNARRGQVARELTRLLTLGVSAPRLAIESARINADRAEYGATHALPVATDILPLLPRFPGPKAVLPLMQTYDLTVEDCALRPLRPRPAPVDPGDDPDAAGAKLQRLVEAEDGEAAEALLRGALARGWGREIVEPWLYGPCCAHFLSFGHPLIYQVKVFDLLEAAGWDHADVVLGGHLRGIVNATREDTLPRWHSFSQRLAASEADLPRWSAGTAPGGYIQAIAPADQQRWWQAIVDGDRDAAFDAVAQALAAGTSPTAIADLIAAAAAVRLLRFDVAIDHDPKIQAGWLDLTHTLTFAVATRDALLRYRDPAGLRLLFFAARFVNNAQTLDAQPAVDVEPAAGASLAGIAAAIAAHDPATCVARTAGYLAVHGPDAALQQLADDLPLQDHYTRPIFAAHGIKLSRSVFEVATRLRGTPWADLPVLALFRFAAAPLRERAIAQLAHEAQRLVVDGKVPKVLT